MNPQTITPIHPKRPSSFQEAWARLSRRPALVFGGATGLLWALGLGAVESRAAVESAAPGSQPSAQQLEFFEQKIRPVLADKCFECHSSDSKSVKGGLLLDSREGWLKGGETGPALDLAKPESSLALKAVHYTDEDMLMPPKKAGGKLPDAVIADLAAWLKQGAPWPAEKKTAKKIAGFDLQARKQAHWCWRPPVAQTPPVVSDGAWPKNGVDRFVLAGLEAAKLKPAPAAEPSSWLRRVSFDLTGLPPTPSELQAFLSDHSGNAAKAREAAVDRLLASPHFGERWARHWMDLVRYAESRGHEFDPVIANAWQYRDYLVRTFNADVPYDRFVKEHIAGDLLPARLGAAGSNESVLGTGFWFLGEEVHSPVDIRQDEADRLDNRLDVMTKSFLGLTVACARCHDHKFDAISQKDYYAMTGFLISSSNRQVRFETIEAERQAAQRLEAHAREVEQPMQKAVAKAVMNGVADSGKQLAAAAEALIGELQTKAETPEARKPLTEACASKHGVDAAALTRWVDVLREARTDARSPLHLLAASLVGAPEQFGRRVEALAERLTTRPPTAPGAAEEAPVVLADYTASGKTPWLQDGFSFGLGPVRLGELLLGEKPERPLLGLVTTAAARRREAWKNIEAVGEAEAGPIKDFKRSGRTLRTPEFTLGEGPVWILARGSGRSYAAVDSHIMVQGPLHGVLLFKWQGGNDWKWVAHNLTAYKGQRAHLELVPEGTESLEIAMVVQSKTEPASLRPELSAVLSLAPHAGQSTPAALIQEAGQQLARAQQALSAGGVGELPAESVFWADWLVRHLDLFCPPGSAARNELAAVTSPWIAKNGELAAMVAPKSQTAPAMFEGSGADEFLLKRGSSRMPMAQVPRRFIEAIAGPEPIKPAGSWGSGRRELAEQIASAGNPLTARVMVNRVWHHLFGRGIVPTVDNFGVLGQEPSHPALLDYLATRFTSEQHWSIKALIRELVLSSTYQMSASPVDPAAEVADPQNVLLHRMNLKRLEGEAIRDAILAVSGRLDPKVGGPSVPVHVTPFMNGRGRPASGPLDGAGRRTLYIAVKRNFLSPMLLAFDFPIPFNAMGKRNVSNVPSQSLVMMNDPFVVEQATRWAENLPRGVTPEERVRGMYMRAFAREPEAAELQDALQFLAEQSAAVPAKPGEALLENTKAWADLCHVVFNAKEFIHLN